MSSIGAPAQSWQWLRPFIPKRVQPFIRGMRKRLQLAGKKLEEPYHSVYPYTQASPARQQSIVSLAKRIEADKIPGDIVECGVLDGGMSALMGSMTGPERKLHLFDAWSGLPETTEEDGEESVKWIGGCVGSPSRVSAVMRKLGISADRLVFHRGWFNDTFPVTEGFPVALAHIDCDFYEPTRLCLEKWYPLLSSGGFMQFDDYESFEGCQKAVDEFLADHPELTLETFGPWGKAYFFRKP